MILVEDGKLDLTAPVHQCTVSEISDGSPPRDA